MSNIHWLGTNSTDMDTASNWEGGVKPDGLVPDDAYFDPAHTGWVQGPMSGTCDCSSIFFVGLTGGNGGTYTVFTLITIDAACTGMAGTYNGPVVNSGGISGGTWSGQVVNDSAGFISGGTFTYSGVGVECTNGGSIGGGDFTDTQVKVSSGSVYIMDGTFGMVDWYGGNLNISAGTFEGGVNAGDGAISGGTFNDSLWVWGFGYTTGGTFNGTTTFNQSASTGTGAFNGPVVVKDSCWVMGGSFHGGLEIQGSVTLSSFDVIDGPATYSGTPGKWLSSFNFKSSPEYVTGIKTGVNGSGILGMA